MKTIISNKIKAQVLFSAGFKTAKSLKRRGNIPLRSAQRYISQLRRGENIVQEASKQRKSCTRSPNIVRKLINKIKMKKGVTLKEISHSVGISQSTTRKILHETGYKQRKYSKRIKITEDARIKRLKFAQKMKNKICQWQSICFSDECIVGNSKTDQKQCMTVLIWTDLQKILISFLTIFDTPFNNICIKIVISSQLILIRKKIKKKSMKNQQKISKYTRVQVLQEAGVKKCTRITKMAKISQSTAYRYISKLKKGIPLERKASSEGNNKIKPQKQKKIISKAKDSKKPMNLKKISEKSKVSKMSVKRILNKNGIKYKKLSGKNLNNIQKIYRVSFCQEMMEEFDLEQLIFADETSFWLNKSRPAFGWSGKTVENECDLKFSKSNLHSSKLNVWGAISLRGTISLEIWTENMTQEIYKNILKKKRREIEKLYPHGYVYISDNDPKHKAKSVQNYMDNYYFSYKFLPPYSPDINPIEMIWSWLKQKVNSEYPTTIENLKKLIRKYWRQINPEMLSPYIQSQQSRYKWIIENNGAIFRK